MLLYTWADLKEIWQNLARPWGYPSRTIMGDYFPFQHYDVELAPPTPEMEAWLAESLHLSRLADAKALIHTTKADEIMQTIRQDTFRFNRNETTSCWMYHTYPGHKLYGGGWFTYGSEYGGPEFGLNLIYMLSTACPILFVPPTYGDNYKHFRKTGQSEKAILDQYVYQDGFSGSTRRDQAQNWEPSVIHHATPTS